MAVDSANVGAGGRIQSDFAISLRREAMRRVAFQGEEVKILRDVAKWIKNTVLAVFPSKELTFILDHFHVLGRSGKC